MPRCRIYMMSRRMFGIQRCNHLILLWFQFENNPFEMLLCSANSRKFISYEYCNWLLSAMLFHRSIEIWCVFSIQSFALCVVAPQWLTHSECVALKWLKCVQNVAFSHRSLALCYFQYYGSQRVREIYTKARAHTVSMNVTRQTVIAAPNPVLPTNIITFINLRWMQNEKALSMLVEIEQFPLYNEALWFCGAKHTIYHQRWRFARTILSVESLFG